MKRKCLAILTILLLMVSLAVIPAFAANTDNLCFDQAYCVDDAQWEEINTKLNDISTKWGNDVIIVTTNDFEGRTAQEYADDIFDYVFTSEEENPNGILFLLNPTSREWAISTLGYGITAFTDAGQAYIMDKITPALSAGNYYIAFGDFADLCDDLLYQAIELNQPYDVTSEPEENTQNIPMDIGLGVLLGVGAGFVATGKDKAALKTVRRQTAAHVYQRENSLNLMYSNEQFLYSTVDRREKPKNNSGGSTTHRSSSGRTHGGSSGSF